MFSLFQRQMPESVQDEHLLQGDSGSPTAARSAGGR